ncbi:transcriptional regulator [Paraconexibacter sp. AEG42_29]|uniref:Transcriptional regulator n=1 Tax=Paraconexibacter sp. AEG42_29 TaxID=2997339 RepID=A0AAU7ATV1_9ACTN
MGQDFRRGFDVGLAAASEARRWLVDALALRGRDAEDVALLVSELVSNSVQHAGLQAGQQVSVRASRTDAVLRVEVSDEGGRFGKASASPDRRDGGRGLVLVSALSDDWGVHPDDTTRLWFTYTTRDAAA